MSYEKWIKSLGTRDVCDRADSIHNFPRNCSKEIVGSKIVEMLTDDNELVRQAAAETLCEFDYEFARIALRHTIERDAVNLVKEYAISSLGAIAELKDVKYLIEMSGKENDKEILTHIYLGIILAARRVFVRELVSHLSSDSVIIRTSSVNALLFAYHDNDISYICDALRMATEDNAHKTDPEGYFNAYHKFLAIGRCYSDIWANSDL